MTWVFIFSGSMGRVSMSHLAHSLSYASGGDSSTRWPRAQVTTYLSPSRQPSPGRLQPSTRASSRPTEGFSASTSVLDTVLTLLFNA